MEDIQEFLDGANVRLSEWKKADEKDLRRAQIQLLVVINVVVWCFVGLTILGL